MIRHWFTALILVCNFFLIALFFSSCSGKTAITILVDASKVEHRITPWLYGACIEDVNHEIYGGLYDQKIFGESFEEPVPDMAFDGFSAYEGSWRSRNDEISVLSHPGAKLVYDQVVLENGSVETEIMFTGKGEGNAGILVHVEGARNGADNFYGYEISLSATGKKVIFGKHKNNFEHIRDIGVNCNPAKWNLLKATMTDKHILVFLNDQQIFIYENNDPSLRKGKVSLRTWYSDATFRNIKITTGNISQTLPFKPKPLLPVSSQWDAILTGDAKSFFMHDAKDAYNGQYAQVIGLASGSGNVGISNAGLNRWGIAVRNGQRFQGRLYLKSPDLKGSVIVALQNSDGTKEYARQEIGNITDHWEKYSFDLVSDTDDVNARFSVYIHLPGKLWIDQVTLMTTGKDQFKGLPFRNDIAQAMVNQGLTFLRYGGTMINVPEYRFKKMIGDPDRRPPYRGHWYRYSTNGFGIEEFLMFCEAAGFKPSFAINIEETPEDMADMIEYLNGPVTSEWGRKRAENGHPEPYHIKYIGIGNEEVLFDGDRADQYDHYIERFNLLYDAIKGKDPSVSLINTAWWRPESPNMERVFKALDGKAEYWDYHPWADQLTSGENVEKELKRMRQLFLQWNPETTMKCVIFEENGNTHNMQRVLGHVTLQNAVRRMGDFVLASCAANALQPYQQNDNGWDQGQIFFTPSQVWGMPPYYAQQIASQYHQPLLVYSQTNDEVADILDITATRSEDGSQLVIHIANTGKDLTPINLEIKHMEKIKKVKTISLSGNLTDVNTPEKPEMIVPVEKNLQKPSHLKYEIAPYSYTLFIFSQF